MKNHFLLSGVTTCFVLAQILSSCAHIPKEAVYLSEELTGMLREAERSHLELLDKHVMMKHQEVDSFLTSVWVPRFMEISIIDAELWALISAEPNAAAKVELMQEFIEDANDVIFLRRTSLHDAISQLESILKQAIQDHYSQMILVNQSLTAHLRSAAKVSETREKLLNQLKIPTGGVLDLKKLDNRIEDIMGLADRAKDEEALKSELGKIVEGFLIKGNSQEP